MFEHTEHPRVFGMPPGADFATALVSGLRRRFDGMDQTAIARTEIYVNTSRMQRRLREVFDAGPPMLLPRVKLVTDLALYDSESLPAPVSPLRRRLELTQLVSALLDRAPEIAPRAALYDLSDSLATLMDEMQGEGVPPSKLAELDVTDQSGHWQRALKFLTLLNTYFTDGSQAPDKEARQRQVIERLVAQWAMTPPDHPIIIAGSTGSRGATRLLMHAVARLPQGALVLPGFDFEMPNAVWDTLGGEIPAEDHPQYRFYQLMMSLNLDFSDVVLWDDTMAPSPVRNRLVSLSLRPAPVTHQWLTEGPNLRDLPSATSGMTLIEAASPRIEAETIALRLRQAAADGLTAALITPDRMLTRQVSAALDRWDIKPDDSAGTPLAQSAPGRLLRHVGQLIGRPTTAEDILVILKHPLCNADGGERNTHLRRTRELELELRRFGPPIIDQAALVDWAQRTSANDPGRIAWAAWIGQNLTDLEPINDSPLVDHLERHIAATETFSRGPTVDEATALWQKSAGREARKTCDMLLNNADAGGTLSVADYINLFSAVLAKGVVRDRDSGHPDILIWGTLEARVQGADLVILGGMNDGVWPESPTPDPWLNRKMRKDAGLLLPDRRIGLSAHDYQQAIAAKEVWITRAKRSADSETVPSRWLNRLTNLLQGLPDQNGPEALRKMRQTGDTWMAQAIALQEPAMSVAKAKRPSPCPPIAARPKELSVTRIKTLIRDPFAIYAEKVLQLRALEPLKAEASPLMRGNIFHAILETLMREEPDPANPATRTRFLEIARAQLDEHCPWPVVRLQWFARLDRVATAFLNDEVARQAKASVSLIEASGSLEIPALGFKITGKADRFDKTPGGEVIIYDYKTGLVPSKTVQANFDKQLLIEAAMVERGAFAGLGKCPVSEAAFIGINTDTKMVPAPLDKHPADQVWDDFLVLLRAWEREDRGYTARLAHMKTDDASVYDHLSRYGEWTMADTVGPEVLK